MPEWKNPYYKPKPKHTTICPTCHNEFTTWFKTKIVNCPNCRYNRLYKHGLTDAQYANITKQCAICDFSELPAEIHHKDHDHKNNNIENLIGLCPNHHQLIHRGYKTLEELLKNKV